MLGVSYMECWYVFSSCIMHMKRCRHKLESAVVRICNVSRQRGIAFCWFGLVRNQAQRLHYQPHRWTQLIAEGPKLSNLWKIYQDYLCSYVNCMVFATMWIDFMSCVIARTWKTKWTLVRWKFIVLLSHYFW